MESQHGALREEPVVNEMNDVIVADDDPLIISVLSEIFNGSGYIVRTASDGSPRSHQYESESPISSYLISTCLVCPDLNYCRFCDGAFLRLPSSQ
jgi:CheY-like chemotaxis protein